MCVCVCESLLHFSGGLLLLILDFSTSAQELCPSIIESATWHTRFKPSIENEYSSESCIQLLTSSLSLLKKKKDCRDLVTSPGWTSLTSGKLTVGNIFYLEFKRPCPPGNRTRFEKRQTWLKCGNLIRVVEFILCTACCLCVFVCRVCLMVPWLNSCHCCLCVYQPDGEHRGQWHWHIASRWARWRIHSAHRDTHPMATSCWCVTDGAGAQMVRFKRTKLLCCF